MRDTKSKVLYVGGFELPDINAAAHRVLANGKILNKLRYEVIYMGISHNKKCSSDVLSTHEIKSYGHDYKIRYPDNNIKWFSYISNVCDIIRILELHKVKIVISYNYPALASYKLYKYCKNNEIKLFSDCTEWYVPEGNILFRIVKGLDSFFRMRVIQPKLDGIITISKFLYEFYSKKNENVVLIPPLVDLSDSKWGHSGNVEKNSVYRFIYAGSPGGKMKEHLGKIISTLIIIREKFNKKFYLDILGITIDEYNEIWKENPIPSSLKKNIRFHGRLSNINVIKKLKAADFSIFIREENLVTKAGFPTKFVESISSGTPVLTNRSSNIEDYLKDGINGCFLDISSINSLVKTLYKVFYCSRNKVNEMKLECKNDTRFNYTEYLNEFTKLLE